MFERELRVLSLQDGLARRHTGLAREAPKDDRKDEPGHHPAADETILLKQYKTQTDQRRRQQAEVSAARSREALAFV